MNMEQNMHASTHQQEETRVAEIHPATGMEIHIHRSPQSPQSCDETQIAGMRRSLIVHSSPITEEFIPHSDALLTGEQTVVWTPSPSRIHRLIAVTRRRPWHAATVATTLFAMISFAVWAVLSSGIQSVAKNSVWTAPAPPNVSIKNDNILSDESPATLQQAVQLLRAGKLKAAKRAYEQLSSQHPGNESYRAAIAILQAQEPQP